MDVVESDGERRANASRVGRERDTADVGVARGAGALKICARGVGADPVAGEIGADDAAELRLRHAPPARNLALTSWRAGFGLVSSYAALLPKPWGG